MTENVFSGREEGLNVGAVDGLFVGLNEGTIDDIVEGLAVTAAATGDELEGRTDRLRLGVGVGWSEEVRHAGFV